MDAGPEGQHVNETAKYEAILRSVASLLTAERDRGAAELAALRQRVADLEARPVLDKHLLRSFADTTKELVRREVDATRAGVAPVLRDHSADIEALWVVLRDLSQAPGEGRQALVAALQGIADRNGFGFPGAGDVRQ
jgi:hypothetical protein